ncbi:MAG: ribonuclease HII [Candidatus Thorarchaeota archaeon]
MITVGVDEAGVGCLAGPLIITAAAFNENKELSKGIKDSKKLSARQREFLIDEIYEKAEWLIIKIVPVAYINKHPHIWSAWTVAMAQLLKSCLRNKVGKIIVDGKKTIPDIKNITYKVKADSKFVQVSAASIVSKYYQTLKMLDIHGEYPIFGFNRHKGYSTSYHKKMLKRYGPTEYHRLNYAPVREVLETHNVKHNSRVQAFYDKHSVSSIDDSIRTVIIRGSCN